MYVKQPFSFFIFRVKKESQDYMELQEQREKWYEYRLTIYLFHIDHNAPCLRPPSPPPLSKVCISFVFDFLRDDCNTQEKFRVRYIMPA